MVLAWKYRAAIKYDARNIEPQQCHSSCRNGLVAGNQGHDTVKHMAARDQFDRIGDHLPAHQRSLHSLGAHRDSIADGDGVELHGSAARRANSLLYLHGQFPQIVIAGHGFDPCIGYPDDRFGEVLVSETDTLQHGSRRCAVTSLSDDVALQWHVSVAIFWACRPGSG